MWILSLIIVIIFFALSGFFSGMETGLISLDRLKMEQAAKRNNKKKKILKFLENPDRIFGTTLFGNNISIVVITTVSVHLIKQFKENSIINLSDQTATLAIAAMILIFAEIIPKAFYRDHPNLYVYRGFSLLNFFSVVFYPFVKFVSIMHHLLAKIFKLPDDKGYHLLTREDISYMLSETPNGEILQEDQREMLEEALEFTELDAENIMIHRTEIVALEKNTPLDEIIQIAKDNGYTRYPVYDADIDHIIGILIIYDLMNNVDNNDAVAGDFVRDTFVVPETMDVDILLTEMQSNNRSMAIVVDSFGGTAGLVTIEDIIEEIVGEIEDEYDTVSEEIQKIGDNQFLIQGFVRIDFLNDEYELNLPEGDYETIAGLIINRLEKIPKQGDQILIDQWKIKIMQASSNKIVSVQLKKTI